MTLEVDRTGMQVTLDIQRQENDEAPLRQKREVYLPPELWDMILDGVTCTSTLYRLCRVSRDLHHAAMPKLYWQIGILYENPSDVSLVNFCEASIKDTVSLRRSSTPFTEAHWDHIRHVRSLTIVDASCDSACSCSSTLCRQCGTQLNSNSDQNTEVFGKLREILYRIASPKSIKWLRDNRWTDIPQGLLETISHRFGDSLESLHLDMRGHPLINETKAGRIETAMHRMMCLKELGLTGVTQSETAEFVGKYLQSPAGKSVRALRFDCTRPVVGIRKLLGFDTVIPDEVGNLEIETLHLRHVGPDESLRRRFLSTMLNPKTLTSITLIDCPYLAANLWSFPNLKRLHLGGKYLHIPAVFDQLPMLEELILSVNANIEEQFYGGITRYFKEKGHELRRLGVLFTQLETSTDALVVVDRRSYFTFRDPEQDFMVAIRDYCTNLEELGIWHTDIFFAESIILRLPKLRAVSLNNNMIGDGPNRIYPPPYPTGLSGISYLFQQTDIETSSVIQRARSQLTFIKQNDEAWRRLEVGEPSRSGDHVMPTMTIRKLSRRDADIPRIFLVEDLHRQQYQLWGSQESSERSKKINPSRRVPTLYRQVR